MDYETIGKLIFGQQRLKVELDFFQKSGAHLGAEAWEALLADVAAGDLAVDELQRRPADADPAQLQAALDRCLRASATLKGLQC